MKIKFDTINEGVPMQCIFRKGQRVLITSGRFAGLKGRITSFFISGCTDKEHPGRHWGCVIKTKEGRKQAFEWRLELLPEKPKTKEVKSK